MTRPEGIALRAENFSESSSNILKNLRKSTEFCDMALGCTDSNGKSLLVHKVIISAFSPVLGNLIKQNMHANSFTSIFVSGILHEDLESLIDYMYEGVVFIDKHRVTKFLSAAQDLKIMSLFEKCLTSILPPEKKISSEKLEEKFNDGMKSACEPADTCPKENTLLQEDDISILREECLPDTDGLSAKKSIYADTKERKVSQKIDLSHEKISQDVMQCDNESEESLQEKLLDDTLHKALENVSMNDHHAAKTIHNKNQHANLGEVELDTEQTKIKTENAKTLRCKLCKDSQELCKFCKWKQQHKKEGKDTKK